MPLTTMMTMWRLSHEFYFITSAENAERLQRQRSSALKKIARPQPTAQPTWAPKHWASQKIVSWAHEMSGIPRSWFRSGNVATYSCGWLWMSVDKQSQVLQFCGHRTNSTRDGVKCPSGAPGSRDSREVKVWGVHCTYRLHSLGRAENFKPDSFFSVMTQSEGVRSVPFAVVPCLFPKLDLPICTLFYDIKRIHIVCLSQCFIHCLTRAAPVHRANTGNTNKREIKESLASASQISQEIASAST